MSKIKKFLNFIGDKIKGEDPPIRATEFLDKFSNDLIYLCQDIIDKIGSPSKVKFYINTSFGTRELEKNGCHLKVKDDNIELKNYLNNSKLHDIKYLQIIVQLVESGWPNTGRLHDEIEDDLDRIKDALEIDRAEIIRYNRDISILITVYNFTDDSGGG